MSEAEPVDPARCPLCGVANGCAMAGRTEGEPLPTNCWCMGAKVDAQALQAIPAQGKGRACICPRCAGSAQPVP